MRKEEKIRALVDSVPTWYHRFEVYPGVFTPGIHSVDASKTLDLMGVERNLEGKRILEIGTWDGAYAFELASRGAKVIAVDIHHPDRSGFNIGKMITKSDVRYVRTSVYDIDKSFATEFDIVIFMGVYYHLRYPLLAFDRIYGVLKNKGTLFFEGEAFSHYAEYGTGRKTSIVVRCLLPFVAHSNLPLILFYWGNYKKDKSNWHIPNTAALEAWLIASGFTVQEMSLRIGEEVIRMDAKNRFLRRVLHSFRFLDHRQRIFGIATKTKDAPAREHIVF